MNVGSKREVEQVKVTPARPPSVDRIDIAPGFRLHVVQPDGDAWEVWLNTQMADFDGIMIGIGTRRETAIADALLVIRTLLLTTELLEVGGVRA